LFDLLIILIEKQADTAFVGFAGFAERYGLPHEIGTTLPEGVVQTFDMGDPIDLW